MSNLNGWPLIKATGGPWVSSTPQFCPCILFLTIRLRVKSKAICSATASRGAMLGPICKFIQILRKKFGQTYIMRRVKKKIDFYYAIIYLFDDGNEEPWILITVPCFKPFCIGPTNGTACKNIEGRSVKQIN